MQSKSTIFILKNFKEAIVDFDSVLELDRDDIYALKGRDNAKRLLENSAGAIRIASQRTNTVPDKLVHNNKINRLPVSADGAKKVIVRK